MRIIRTHREPAPWSSFDRLSSLRDLLDSAFQLAGTSSGYATDRAWAPLLDVHENSEAVIVQLEAGGLKKEDFDISLHDDNLTISGERRLETDKREGESFRSERFFGAFSRTIQLPSAVKTDAVTASYTDGVLTVTLPKAEDAKPKKIEVNVR